MPGPPSSPTHTLRDVPAAAGGTGEAVLRRRMVRLAYAPALVVALAAAGAMAYLWFARDPDDATTVDTGFGDAATPGVLGAALLIAVAALAFGVRSASAQARTTLDQYAALRRGAEHSRFQIQDLLRKLEAGEPPSSPASGHPPPALPGSAGVLGSLAQELALAQRSAEAAVAQAAALPRRNRAESAGAGEGGQRLQAADRVTVFVNLSRRLQSLLHREIKVLDELENQVEDPEILKSVFQVDHLATRIRRYAENLAVLGGAVSRRQWTKPVRLSEIMRSSAAEVEHYLRIKLVPPIEGTVRGQAVADVIHLLAELVENATVYSAPQTQVLLRASHVTAGLAIEVEDRGLGMTGDEQRRMNALLADPEDVDVAALLTDGRIGLYVVGTLARRHGIAVELRSNIYGGIQAVLVLPHSMLGDREGVQQHGSAPAGPGGGPGAASHAAPAAMAPGSTPTPEGPAAPAETALPEGRPDRTVPRRASAPEPTLRLQRGRHAAPSPPAPAPPPEPAPRPHPTPPPGTPPDGASAPRRTPVNEAAGPVSASPAGPDAGQPREPAGGRPPLPLRRKQQHIVPELRDTAATRSGATGGRGEAEAVHNPGLMAAFQRGVGRADAEERDRPSSPSPPPPPSPYDGDSRFP
ncbi:ATP-binding protein [Streptomyces sp. NPDC007083]|uniref:sensor histidine kinase n=1 Tax=Streptomyces sp. NPDC007083 TaxID=3156913 RepID=UPI0033F4CEE6